MKHWLSTARNLASLGNLPVVRNIIAAPNQPADRLTNKSERVSNQMDIIPTLSEERTFANQTV